MNTRLTRIAAAGVLAAGATLTPLHASAAGVRVCTMPGSPSASLDKSVAQAVFRSAGIAASFVSRGIDGGGDDDGISAHELVKSLAKDCDVIAGFPRSALADASDTNMIFSRGYLRSGYVSVTRRDAHAAATSAAGKETIAATYSSPSQLIAVQQQNARFDLENTSELTVDAIVKGRAQRAIVWYPAVVAYRHAHPGQRFDVSPTASPYADWNLAFAFGHGHEDLQKRVDAVLSRMSDDGSLAALTRNWALPNTVAQASHPHASARFAGQAAATGARAGLLPVTTAAGAGGFIKVTASAGGGAPAFDHEQVEHGKHLYASSCAKCHGEQLEGITAPALSGPAFAPAAHSHLTIGGIYQYMSTNMPADRPGKMTDQEYADLMAFLLYTNGYDTSATKLTADAARASTTPLNAGPRK